MGIRVYRTKRKNSKRLNFRKSMKRKSMKRRNNRSRRRNFRRIRGGVDLGDAQLTESVADDMKQLKQENMNLKIQLTAAQDEIKTLQEQIAVLRQADPDLRPRRGRKI